MNRTQLEAIIAKRTDLDAKEIDKLLTLLEDSIKNSLFQNQRVSLANFGTFYPFKTKSRTIPNPKNPKQKMLTLGREVIKFKPADSLKKKVFALKFSNKIASPSLEEKLLKIVTKPSRIPYIELKNRKIPKEVLAKIPEQIARTYQIVPVEQKGNRLLVAMINPEDLEAIEFVKKKTGLTVDVGITTSSGLSSVLDQYGEVSREMERVVKEMEGSETKEKTSKVEKPTELEISSTAPTARLVGSILNRAVKERASDIHIEPQEDGIWVRFRIDGVLQKILELPKELLPTIVARVKILSNMKIDETRIPQDGRFSITVFNNEIDFRVSTFPTVYGEKIVMRILDKSKGLLTLEELGLRGRDFKILDENIHKAHGMILITGPTGCGKTTTLYAVLDRIYDVGINIVTLEDPVEYRLKGINQSQVNPRVNYDFASGLRSIVRQDPDVIMLGEIRDNETASMAVHAALTGHVVLSTLHTNDAAGAIPRLIDMKVEPFLIASSLNLVIAQRLCRKICENCKRQYPVPREIVAEIQREVRVKKVVLYKGQGCSFCNQTGYKGRIAIFEVLPVSERIKDLILKKVSGGVIAQQAIKEGMLTLKQDGIQKALEGITTIEEVWRATRD